MTPPIALDKYPIEKPICLAYLLGSATADLIPRAKLTCHAETLWTYRMAHKNHRGPVHGGGEGSEQKDLKTYHQGLRIKVKHLRDSLSNVEQTH